MYTSPVRLAETRFLIPQNEGIAKAAATKSAQRKEGRPAAGGISPVGSILGRIIRSSPALKYDTLQGSLGGGGRSSRCKGELFLIP